MKAKYSLLVCLVAVFAMAAVAGIAAADSETLTVPVGSPVPQNLGSMNEGDLLSISWSTSGTVSAVITGPSGYSRSYSSSDFPVDLIDVPHDGAYTIAFTNEGSSSTTVVLTWDVSPISPGGILDDLVTLFIIVAVVVIVIIVVVVVLVFMLGKKKKQAAPLAGAPQGIVMPTTPGVCPVCGAQTDTNAQFCAKCGARYR
jgi:hypothetical protein